MYFLHIAYRSLTSTQGLSALMMVVLLSGCGEGITEPPTHATVAIDAIPSIPANVNSTRANAAANEPHNWMLHGRTYNEQRFSPLKQVNTETISQLGLAWHWEGDYNRGYEGSFGSAGDRGLTSR